MSTLSTHEDLLRRLGGIATSRVRTRPAPGTATVADVIDIQDREGVLCELIEGVLVEKAMGYSESILGGVMFTFLYAFVLPRNLGLVSAADGALELVPGLVRAPDVAFTSWDRFPGRRRPTAPVPAVAPNLAVEILSRSNTPGEMALKRRDYFAAGVELVWEIDPAGRTVRVFTSPTAVTTLTAADALDGGTVLPGFAVAVGDVFAELDRRG
jgi:Uma2 family endonuclease